MNRVQVTDELIANAFIETGRVGGVDWSTFVANLMGASPYCSDTHMECPRCHYREEFARGEGPVEFTPMDVEPGAEPYVVRIYRCPASGCGHRFAPTDGGRYNAFHTKKVQRPRSPAFGRPAYRSY